MQRCSNDELILTGILSAAAALIGTRLRRIRMQWFETARRDAIRYFAWRGGDDNPLWLNDDYVALARALLASACILCAVDSDEEQKLPDTNWARSDRRGTTTVASA
jgi:hypothetical protein